MDTRSFSLVKFENCIKHTQNSLIKCEKFLCQEKKN